MDAAGARESRLSRVTIGPLSAANLQALTLGCSLRSYVAIHCMYCRTTNSPDLSVRKCEAHVGIVFSPGRPHNQPSLALLHSAAAAVSRQWLHRLPTSLTGELCSSMPQYLRTSEYTAIIHFASTQPLRSNVGCK